MDVTRTSCKKTSSERGPRTSVESEAPVLCEEREATVKRYGAAFCATVIGEGRIHEGTIRAIRNSLGSNRGRNQAFPAGCHGRNPQTHGRLEQRCVQGIRPYSAARHNDFHQANVLGGVSGALCGALNVGCEVEDEMVGEATVEVNENERLNLKFPFRFQS